MNDNGVTTCCGRCDRPSVVIIGGAHFCSSHGLDVTLVRLAQRQNLVVDLRSELITVGLPEGAVGVDEPLRALAG